MEKMMTRKSIISDILVDEGVSLKVQEEFSDEELYAFAEEACMRNNECLEDILLSLK